jgi:hypothetical protein
VVDTRIAVGDRIEAVARIEVEALVHTRIEVEVLVHSRIEVEALVHSRIAVGQLAVVAVARGIEVLAPG